MNWGIPQAIKEIECSVMALLEMEGLDTFMKKARPVFQAFWVGSFEISCLAKVRPNEIQCCTLLTRIWNFFDLEFSVPNARTFQTSDRFWLLKLGKPVNWRWVQSVSHRNWLVTSSTVCTVYSVHCSRSNGLGIQVLQLVWDQEQGDSSSNLEFIWSDSLRLTFPKKLAVLESSLEIPNLQLSLPSSPQRMDGGTLQTNEVNSSMWGLNTPIWCRG